MDLLQLLFSTPDQISAARGAEIAGEEQSNTNALVGKVARDPSAISSLSDEQIGANTKELTSGVTLSNSLATNEIKATQKTQTDFNLQKSQEEYAAKQQRAAAQEEDNKVIKTQVYNSALKQGYSTDQADAISKLYENQKAEKVMKFLELDKAGKAEEIKMRDTNMKNIYEVLSVYSNETGDEKTAIQADSNAIQRINELKLTLTRGMDDAVKAGGAQGQDLYKKLKSSLDELPEAKTKDGRFNFNAYQAKLGELKNLKSEYLTQDILRSGGTAEIKNSEYIGALQGDEAKQKYMDKTFGGKGKSDTYTAKQLEEAIYSYKGLDKELAEGEDKKQVFQMMKETKRYLKENPDAMPEEAIEAADKKVSGEKEKTQSAMGKRVGKTNKYKNQRIKINGKKYYVNENGEVFER